MKKTRRIAAMLAALTLAACAVAPSMMFASADYTITFDQTNGTNTDKTYAGDSATHTYEAYQIFKGTLITQTTGETPNQVTKKILSDIDWGTGVDFTKTGKGLDSLVTALKADNSITAFSSVTTTGKTDKEVAQAIADALTGENNDSNVAIFFAKTIAGYLSDMKTTGDNTSITGITNAGYYLVQDATGSPDAASAGTEASTTYALNDSDKLSALAIVLANVQDSGITVDSDEATVAEYIYTNFSTDAVANAVKSVDGYSEITSANDVVTKTETAATDATPNGAKTRYILTVVDDVTVKTKNSAPTAIKKVKENVTANYATEDVKIGDITADQKNTGYNDVADYSIGDSVPFKLYGTLPDAATYADYNAYYYKFTDKLGKEFTQPETVTVKAGSATLIFKKDASDATKYNLDNSSTNTLASGVNQATGDVSVTWTAGASGAAGTLAIVFDNIKDYIATIPATAPVITVEYDAVLNTNAVTGLSGQENAVQLTYSSNPNVTWTPSKDNTPDTPNGEDTEETEEDRVIVFTYELDINKVDGADKTTKLAGAKFIVKAVDGDHANKYVKVDANNKVSGWLDTAPTKDSTDGVFTSTTTGVISIIGLDDGQYEITELVAPESYNPLAAPKTWTIEATTNNTQAWNNFKAADALTAIDLKEDNASIDEKKDTDKGIVEGKIENKSGTTLPSTGGIGTTLFYLAGGVMVVGAGVVLVTKKRLGKED